MAIRQIGGQPVYVVEVDVPKVTDARGRSYGTLVSDLRWKLWEEVQNSQLQQMKFEQMSKQAQLDVLEQKQRDISRAIRDANELKSQIKAETTKGTAPARGYVEKTEKPAIDPYSGLPTGTTIETTRTRTPTSPVKGGLEGTSGTVESEESVAARKSELDEYIKGLEAQQTQLGQEFTRFAAQPSRDLLGSTRDAFQTQIGEGGFGISRRPLRQLPRFDEAEAVGRVQDTIAREEEALLNEARRRKRESTKQRIMELEQLYGPAAATGPDGKPVPTPGGGRFQSAEYYQKLQDELNAPLSLDEERRVRELARKKVAEGMTAAGAEPTSRAGFLMKDFPQGSALLPREETRFPTGRMRDDFGVEGRTALNREAEILRDLTREPEKVVDELVDEYQVRRSTERGDVPESPLEYSVRRNIELEAMGEPPAYDVNSPPTIEDAVIRAGQEQLDTSRLPRDRGFDTPVEQMGQGFGATTTFGRPGGVLDRLNVRTRKNVGGTAEIVDPDTGETIDPTQPQTPAPAPAPTQSQPQTSREATPVGGRIPLGDGVMYDPLDRVIYGKEGFPIFRESKEANPNSAAPYQPQIVTPKELDKKVREIKEAGGYEPPQAKNTLPQRRERYAMKTIKQGLELSEKPKQLARLAKTNDPAKAPEYVQLVNKVFELNSTRPDRFKISFDEIARAYKDDPSTREKAHSYLVAIDAVQSNITKPT